MTDDKGQPSRQPKKGWPVFFQNFTCLKSALTKAIYGPCPADYQEIKSDICLSFGPPKKYAKWKFLRE